jgi:hypothetical protein
MISPRLKPLSVIYMSLYSSKNHHLFINNVIPLQKNEDLMLLRGWLVEVWKALSVDCPFVQVCRFFLPLRFFLLLPYVALPLLESVFTSVRPRGKSMLQLTFCKAPHKAGLFSFCSRMCPHLACNDTRDNDPLSQWHHLNRYVIYI